MESILCATDLSPAGLNAYAHALMIAVTLRCHLTLFHAGQAADGDLEWSVIPGVREVLERWGYLEKGSPRSAVFEKAAVSVKKVYVQSRDALGQISAFLEEDPVDLVVIGTGGTSGMPSWLRPSASHRIAPGSLTMTMFVPASGGFVSMEQGGVALRRVLIPVNAHPDPHPAITYGFRAAAFSSEDSVEMNVLHVGASDRVPPLDLPERDYLRWHVRTCAGVVPDQILRTAAELDAGLIAMTTAGGTGVLDALRGSVTERVIRGANCPVLAVPLAV